ncbi:MAG: sigma-70 family polymerase sigma factor [Ferruginibacter sp.]|nr:sigma-70 family polymerase sigma factor [Ferruginibacter sp.]
MTPSRRKWLQITFLFFILKNLPCNGNLYLFEGVISLFMHNATEDNEIICRVLKGDQQAFAGLVKGYRHFVFTIALRYTDNREDAEELAQDVFVKAYRSLADFRHQSKFSTWLYTIAANTCRSFLRKRKTVIHSLSDETTFNFVNSNGQGMSGDGQMAEPIAAMMNHSIGLLNADDATIITLFYKGDQSLEEIGQVMGITPNTAKVKLFRARQRLKEKLEKHFSGELKEIRQ